VSFSSERVTRVHTSEGVVVPPTVEGGKKGDDRGVDEEGMKGSRAAGRENNGLQIENGREGGDVARALRKLNYRALRNKKMRIRVRGGLTKKRYARAGGRDQKPSHQ